MFHSPTASIRQTQRVPRSCVSCSARKVKCDKSVPCRTCIRRGKADVCIREMVIVRGEVTTYREAPDIPTYEELKCENERLQGIISSFTAQDIITASRSSPKDFTAPVETDSCTLSRGQLLEQDEDGLEQELWDDLTHNSQFVAPMISNWSDIVLPSLACSEHLIDFDEMWNSWVHYALEYPRFRRECSAFMAEIDNGTPIELMNTPWMAVYFSVLSAALLIMDEDHAEKVTANEASSHHQLSRMWYEAAIFCLNRSDFMRYPNIHSVQAIAVLGICFNNFGDSDLSCHMWSCALRIAQRLGLNTPYSQEAGHYLSKESQHRLWWTLVICEWLSIPYHAPAVDEDDFDVPYPEPPPCSTSATSGLEQAHPVHYHLFMARAATASYRFRRSLRYKTGSTAENTIQAVKAADEELASIIDTLPFHLQPETSPENDAGLHNIDKTMPWVKWQRFDLTLVLLHLRIRVNRTLQRQWSLNSNSSQIEWARTICNQSAQSIIWINSNWDQPTSARKQWALSYHIFTAAILLLHESQHAEETNAASFKDAIMTAVTLLDAVKIQSALAHSASTMLKSRIQAIGLN
ncbi:hypothetical protein DE146DRAFT_127980 [Phaeosphaeria sp. MPI-PUGE-AT-0046c]|nr:hypothetical protein DE146DRAFT_127980 [Phaeosphaeria sp. MPI-PUGE-AT-0046c]